MMLYDTNRVYGTSPIRGPHCSISVSKRLIFINRSRESQSGRGRRNACGSKDSPSRLLFFFPLFPFLSFLLLISFFFLLSFSLLFLTGRDASRRVNRRPVHILHFLLRPMKWRRTTQQQQQNGNGPSRGNTGWGRLMEGMAPSSSLLGCRQAYRQYWTAPRRPNVAGGRTPSKQTASSKDPKSVVLEKKSVSPFSSAPASVFRNTSRTTTITAPTRNRKNKDLK